MKNALAIALVALIPRIAVAAPENYTLDPYHTYPAFVVEHWGLSMMRGQFDKSSGRFSFDRAAKTGSVELTIVTSSITTGDNVRGDRPRARDEHLRSGDFFNTVEFPTMTFKSTQVAFAGELPASVEGNLTLLGVTKPLTLSFERFRCGTHPFNKKDRCGGNAVGKFKRSEFGMKYAIPSVSDEVLLSIEFEGDRD